jgi:hypothetical protein
VLGQIIYSEEKTSVNYPVTTRRIDVSNYEEGAYFLSIDVDKNIVRQKFIISK